MRPDPADERFRARPEPQRAPFPHLPMGKGGMMGAKRMVTRFPKIEIEACR